MISEKSKEKKQRKRKSEIKDLLILIKSCCTFRQFFLPVNLLHLLSVSISISIIDVIFFILVVVVIVIVERGGGVGGGG